MQLLVTEAGTAFDPRCVEALEQILLGESPDLLHGLRPVRQRPTVTLTGLRPAKH